jgi:hypothetical protein
MRTGRNRESKKENTSKKKTNLSIRKRFAKDPDINYIQQLATPKTPISMEKY